MVILGSGSRAFFFGPAFTLVTGIECLPYRRKDNSVQVTQIEGLADIVNRPHLERPASLRLVVEGGEHDDRYPWVVSTKALEHVETAETGQPDVEEDQVRALALNSAERLLAIDGPSHGIPLAFEVFGYGVEDFDLVLDKQDFR